MKGKYANPVFTGKYAASVFHGPEYFNSSSSEYSESGEINILDIVGNRPQTNAPEPDTQINNFTEDDPHGKNKDPNQGPKPNRINNNNDMNELNDIDDLLESLHDDISEKSDYEIKIKKIHDMFDFIN